MGIFDFFESAISTVADVVSEAGDVASNVTSGVVDIAGDVVSGVASVVGDVAIGVSDVAGNVTSGVVDIAGDVVSGVADAVVENPGKTLLIVAGTVTGAMAAPLIAGTTAGVIGVASSSAAGSVSAAAAATAGAVAGATTTSLGVTTQSALLAAGITAKQSALHMTTGFVTKQVGEHVVDNYIRDTVKPVKGSIVYCDLALIAEHSGIYVGDGKIVHLDGSGSIELVNKKEFIDRLGGANVAVSVYVSCFNKTPSGEEGVAERAMAMLGKKRNYNLLINNCHQFTSGCISDNFENADNFLWMLKHTAEQKYKTNSWRVWV